MFNLDISDLVINQMKAANSRDRPELVFQKMDVTKLSHEDDSFSVVLDKGTLDALYTGTDEAVVDTVEKMWSQVARVLRIGGR